MIVARGLGNPGRLIVSSGLGKVAGDFIFIGGAIRFCLYIMQTVVRTVER